jgi:hypothetical protein
LKEIALLLSLLEVFKWRINFSIEANFIVRHLNIIWCERIKF